MLEDGGSSIDFLVEGPLDVEALESSGEQRRPAALPIKEEAKYLGTVTMLGGGGELGGTQGT